MSNALLARGMRRSLAQIRYVSPVMPGTAGGLVASVYAQAERDFGMVAPPLALHSPASAPLAAAWVMLRETLLATGQASRAEKEVVAAAVSAANACPYCVAVHTAAAQGLVPGLDRVGITSGDLANPVLAEIAGWARSTSRPGPTPDPPVGNFAELAGVAVTFHYLNRMVTVFLPESPLPSRTPKPVGGWIMGMLASAMVRSKPAPGASLDLLPDAPLPAEFSWAAGEPRVAAALARAAAAIAEGGARVVPQRVAEMVEDRLRSWDGQPFGLSRSWADAAVAALTGTDRAAGRLALLTALAPYQVAPSDIEDLAGSGDEALIALTSWASMAAARRVGSWLREPSPDPTWSTNR
jgi:alkylhydroperoxidase family enzyme